MKFTTFFTAMLFLCTLGAVFAPFQVSQTFFILGAVTAFLGLVCELIFNRKG